MEEARKYSTDLDLQEKHFKYFSEQFSKTKGAKPNDLLDLVAVDRI